MESTVVLANNYLVSQLKKNGRESFDCCTEREGIFSNAYMCVGGCQRDPLAFTQVFLLKLSLFLKEKKILTRDLNST